MSEPKELDPFLVLLFDIHNNLETEHLRYIMDFAKFDERDKEAVDLDGKRNSFEIFRILQKRIIPEENCLSFLAKIFKVIRLPLLEKKVKDYLAKAKPNYHYGASACYVDKPNDLHCSDSKFELDLQVDERLEELKLSTGGASNDLHYSSWEDNQQLPLLDRLLDGGESAIQTDGPAVMHKAPSSRNIQSSQNNLQPQSRSDSNSMEKNVASSVKTDGSVKRSRSLNAAETMFAGLIDAMHANRVKPTCFAEEKKIYSPTANTVSSGNTVVQSDLDYRVLMLLTGQQSPMKTSDIVKKLLVQKTTLNSCLYRLKDMKVLELAAEQPQMWRCVKK